MKPIEYYLNLPPALVDMNDTDTPESVKIAARIALENERNSILEIEESKRTEKMKARLVAIGKVLETGVTLASLFK